MYLIVRKDNWVWNYRTGTFDQVAEPDLHTYVDRYRARRVAVRVGSLQGSTGEPLTVLPIDEWETNEISCN